MPILGSWSKLPCHLAHGDCRGAEPVEGFHGIFVSVGCITKNCRIRPVLLGQPMLPDSLCKFRGQTTPSSIFLRQAPPSSGCGQSKLARRGCGSQHVHAHGLIYLLRRLLSSWGLLRLTCLSVYRLCIDIPFSNLPFALCGEWFEPIYPRMIDSRHLPEPR